jgi:hypothetical protein
MAANVMDGLKCPPVNCAPQQIARKSESDMNILEKTPLLVASAK